ncbi:octopamine receptor oamb [Sarcoptes scabiei]|nr:octopamine receptor oamb [Sarcoptes scabiei]
MLGSISNESFQEFLQHFESPEEDLQRIDSQLRRLKSDRKKSIANVSSQDGEEMRRYLNDTEAKIDQLRQAQAELNFFLKSENLDQNDQTFTMILKQKTLIKQIEFFDDIFALAKDFQLLLKESKKQLENLDFLQSYNTLKEISEILRKLGDNIETGSKQQLIETNHRKDFLATVTKLESSLTLAKEEFLYSLILIFKKRIYFNDEDAGDDSRRKNPIQTFHFDFLSTMQSKQFESYLNCILLHRNDFEIYLNNIFLYLTTDFIRPILIGSKTFTLIECDQNQTIRLESIESDELDGEDRKLEEIFQRIQKFIATIINLFTLNKAIDNYDAWSQLIGEIWSESLFETIIHSYYEKNIPKNESELPKFLESFCYARQIESYFKSIGSITNEKSYFDKYCENITENFSSLLCEEFLIRMKTILIQPQNSYVSDEILQNFSLKERIKFSSCQCSDYMIEVKKLIEEMSALLENSSTNLGPLLIETIHLVCELFITIAPYRSRALIEIDCKQNAIFHNNCLLFGHLIECLVLKHKPKLDSLYELVPTVRNIASQIFLNQMKFQEQTFANFIRNDTFQRALEQIANEIPQTELRISSQSHYEFRQGLNDCLKHLNHLHNSFNDVLSKKIHQKAMSTILKIILNQFIETILSLNDITSLGSSHLFNEIDYFSKECKLFLIDSEDVIFKWMQLNEINQLFKSSLFEILNRWAEGQGILATYVPADQVRHLIRALFQNNERRATVLAKIK